MASSLVRLFREEVERKVGHPHELLVPDRAPEWRDVEELYPNRRTRSAELAAALGFGGPGEHRAGTRAYKRRAAFMGQVRRWNAGTINPLGTGRWAPRLRSMVRSAWRRASTPANARHVLDIMTTHGATVTSLHMHFSESERSRARTFDRSVAISAPLLRATGFTEAVTGRVDWDTAANAFVIAWGTAYDIGELVAEVGVRQVTRLRFRLGFDWSADYPPDRDKSSWWGDVEPA